MTSQVDLLEVFSDREVSMFGVTAKFKELAQMCPVDLSDTRITLEAKNEFVVRAANEAGLGVDAKYEPMFSQIIERHGLERKFTVTESDKAPIVEKGAIADRRIGEIKPTPIPIEAKNRQAPAQRPEVVQAKSAHNVEKIQRQLRIAGIVALNELARKRELREEDEKVVPAATAHARAITEKPAARPRTRQYQESAPAAATMQRKEAATLVNRHNSRQGNGESSRLPGEARAATTKEEPTELEDSKFPVHLAEKHNEAILFSEEVPRQIVPELIEDAALLPVIGEYSPSSIAKHESLALMWEVELYKEPVDIYNDFTESLSVFMARSDTRLELSEEDPLAFAASSLKEETQSEACPPIVACVIERLAEVDDSKRESIAPIMKHIVGAVHGIYVLEANGAAQEAKEATEKQLKASCMDLLDALALEYNEETLSQFIGAMLHPEFNPSLAFKKEELTISLDNMGTREAKHYYKGQGSRLLQTGKHLEQILGNFVLFCTRLPRNQLNASFSESAQIV